MFGAPSLTSTACLSDMNRQTDNATTTAPKNKLLRKKKEDEEEEEGIKVLEIRWALMRTSAWMF